ncbi:MAG TPA: translocation/assembly module TamB domain-containing protein, partial [Kofleriaceae bacterium]|nr:translocation/assembly module TamB domain-containing protein [Kofleriaceae bacterium]
MLKALLIMFALIVVLLAVALGLAHTDWGREQIRGRVVTQVSELLDGELEVGRLRGSVLGRMELEDVVIRDRHGKAVIQARRLVVDYAPRSLLSQHLDVQAIELEGARILVAVAPDGTVNLTTLLRPDPDDQEAGWDVTVDRITITDSTVTIVPANGRSTTITAIDIAVAEVVLAGDRLGARLDHATATWAEAAMKLAVSGEAYGTGGAYRARLELRAGDSTLTVPEAFFYEDGGVQVEELAVHVSRADAGAMAAAHPALARAADLLVDVDALVEVRRDDGGAPVRLEADLTAAGAELGAAARVDLDARAIEAVVYGRGLKPAQVMRGAPELDLGMNLRIEARGPSLASLGGRIEGVIDGRLDAVEAARLTIDVSALDGRVTGTLVSEAAGAVARTSVVARLDTQPIHIDTATVDGNIAPLAALLPRSARVRVRGPVQVAVQASGPVGAIAAGGTVVFGRVRVGETSVRSGTLELEATGIPDAPVGVAELELRGVRAGSIDIGPVRVTARSTDLGEDIAVTARAGTRRSELELRLAADLQRGSRATEVALGAIRARVRDLVLTGSGGRITLGADGNVAARDVGLRSTAGRLTAEGDLRGGLRLRLTGADLAALARAAAAPPGPSGRVDLDAVIRRRGASYGAQLTGTATGVALRRGTARVDGTFEATVEPGVLTIAGDFDGGALGTAHLDLEGRAPRDPTSRAAWIALGPRLARAGHLKLTGISIAQVLAAAQQPPTAAGRIDAELTLSGDGDRIDGTITLADARVDGLDTSAAGTITVGLGQGVATIEGSATVREVGELTVTGRGRIPARLLDIAAWQALDERAIESLDATTSVISLDRLAARARSIPELALLGGTVSARVTANDRAELVTIDLTARGLTGEIPRVPVDVTAHAEVRRDQTVATIRGGFRGSPELVATLTLGAGLRVLRAPTPAALERITLRGTADLADQRLKVISAAAAPLAGIFTAGTMDLHAVLGGSVGDPTGRAKVVLKGPTVDGVEFAGVTITGDARRSAVSGSIAARQRKGGRLTLRGTADPNAVEALDAHLFAHQFDLGFVSRFVPIETGTIVDDGGTLDGTLAVTGTTRKPVATGRLTVSGAELRAAALARPLTAVDLRATFEPGKVALTGKTKSGAGSARVTGEVTIAGIELRTGSLSVSTKQFPVLAGEMVLAVDSEATARLTATERRMDIGIEIDRALVIVPRKSTNRRELHEIRTYSDVVFVDADARAEAAATRGTRSSSQLVTVALRARDSIRVRGEEINAIVAVDLRAKLLPDGAAITGTVEITQGHLELFDRRYDIGNATMAFNGTIPADPRLDVRLNHDFGEVTVSIVVGGTLSEPTVKFVSEPAIYDQATLLAIVLGQDPGEAENTEALSDRAVSLASGVIVDQLRSLAQDALPIDVLRLEENTTESGTKERRVVVGVWLTDDLFVAYRYGTAADIDDNSNQVEVQYRLGRRWRIEAAYGDAGNGG